MARARFNQSIGGEAIPITSRYLGRDGIAAKVYRPDGTWARNSGYEFTGGFAERSDGQSGATDIGSNFAYTRALATSNTWKRFGFSVANQAANDNVYWTDPDTANLAGFDQTKGLFGGIYLPGGYTDLFDFSFDDSSAASSFSAAESSGDNPYTAATGAIRFPGASVGDYLNCRFDFNVIPQVQNTTVEVGLIFATRNASDEITFTFPLTTQPIFFGMGSVGKVFLSRPIITAYFASNEDTNAVCLPAVRADNPCLFQPLTTLCTILR